MEATTFPVVHSCLHPVGDGCINTTSSRLTIPLMYSSKHNSLNSLPLLAFRDSFEIVSSQRCARGIRIQITRHEFTSHPVFENHAYSIRIPSNRTVIPKANQLRGGQVGSLVGSPQKWDCHVSTKESLTDHEEEKPSSKENSSTCRLIEVGDAGCCPSLLEEESGIKYRYFEERDDEAFSKQIVELSRSNKLKSALELFLSMKRCRWEPNSHACNSLLACLLRNNMLDDAFGVFEYMKNKETTSRHTFGLLFKAVARIQGNDEAVQMFMEIVSDSELKKDIDVIVYNTLISACAKANDWLQMQRVWVIMKENGLIGTSVTYNILVCTFARCGQYGPSISAYNEMLQNEVKPDVDSMHAVIGACAKEGNWELALSVYENILVSGLKPNLVACNALIYSLGKAGEAGTAFRVYHQMRLFGHTPDAYTCNALLGALYITKRYAEALQLFHDIRKEQGLQLNVELYNTALMCCQRLRLWDKGLQLLWLMENSGLSVMAASYNLVIGSCEGARKPKIALQVFEHMIHMKCPADTFTYLSLARSCIWGSLWSELEAILQMTSNVSLYNTVIQGMCLRGRVESAKQLYTKMREIGLVPDGKTRAMMLQHLWRDSS